MPEITISAKDLGAMALKDFCPRCFWIKHKSAGLPWQIFPGIFSSIDSYTKNIVHAYIDDMVADCDYRPGDPIAPKWLPNYERIASYMPYIHFTKFSWRDPDTGVTIRTVPDDRFRMIGGSVMIPDYKTAKYTAAQDELLPMYRVQNNASSIIQEKVFGDTVHSTPLIYCEPRTDKKRFGDIDPSNVNSIGFAMNFSAHVVEIKRDHQLVLDLMAKAKGILESGIPDSMEGCTECWKLNGIIGLIDQSDKTSNQ